MSRRSSKSSNQLDALREKTRSDKGWDKWPTPLTVNVCTPTRLIHHPWMTTELIKLVDHHNSLTAAGVGELQDPSEEKDRHEYALAVTASLQSLLKKQSTFYNRYQCQQFIEYFGQKWGVYPSSHPNSMYKFNLKDSLQWDEQEKNKVLMEIQLSYLLTTTPTAKKKSNNIKWVDCPVQVQVRIGPTTQSAATIDPFVPNTTEHSAGLPKAATMAVNNVYDSMELGSGTNRGEPTGNKSEQIDTLPTTESTVDAAMGGTDRATSSAATGGGVDNAMELDQLEFSTDDDDDEQANPPSAAEAEACVDSAMGGAANDDLANGNPNAPDTGSRNGDHTDDVLKLQQSSTQHGPSPPEQDEKVDTSSTVTNAEGSGSDTDHAEALGAAAIFNTHTDGDSNRSQVDGNCSKRSRSNTASNKQMRSMNSSYGSDGPSVNQTTAKLKKQKTNSGSAMYKTDETASYATSNGANQSDPSSAAETCVDSAIGGTGMIDGTQSSTVSNNTNDVIVTEPPDSTPIGTTRTNRAANSKAALDTEHPLPTTSPHHEVPDEMEFAKGVPEVNKIIYNSSNLSKLPKAIKQAFAIVPLKIPKDLEFIAPKFFARHSGPNYSPGAAGIVDILKNVKSREKALPLEWLIRKSMGKIEDDDIDAPNPEHGDGELVDASTMESNTNKAQGAHRDVSEEWRKKAPHVRPWSIIVPRTEDGMYIQVWDEENPGYGYIIFVAYGEMATFDSTLLHGGNLGGEKGYPRFFCYLVQNPGDGPNGRTFKDKSQDLYTSSLEMKTRTVN